MRKRWKPAPSDRERITAAVRGFYRDLPFNYYASALSAAKRLDSSNPVAGTYPDLDRLLSSGNVERVVEFGCGAGWLKLDRASLPRSGPGG